MRRTTHIASRLVTLVALTLAGLVLVPSSPGSATPELSGGCQYIRDNSAPPGTTYGVDGDIQDLLLASGYSFNAGEKIRLEYNAGADNKARVNFELGVTAEYPTRRVDVDEYIYGAVVHTYTYTFPASEEDVDFVAAMTMEVGNGGTVRTVCYVPNDTDGDHVDDVDDNCVTVSNANQKDSDHDGIGDLCDEDPIPPKLDQTVDIAQPSDTVVGGVDVSVSATASSGLGIDFGATPFWVCEMVNGKVHPVGFGECTVTAYQDGNADYNPAQASKKLQVGKGSQTITFTQPPDLAVGDADVSLLATSSAGGGGIVFSSQTPTTCSVTPSKAHAIAAGSCTIAANRAADGNYNAAPEVTRTLTVSPPDGDHDGIADEIDNCPDTPNVDQADTDGDDIGDLCDQTPNGTPVSITATAPSPTYEYGATVPATFTPTYSGYGEGQGPTTAPTCTSTAVTGSTPGTYPVTCTGGDAAVAGVTNHTYSYTFVAGSLTISDPQCSDGLDNNENGAADFPFDLGCSSALDTSEIETVTCVGSTIYGNAKDNVLFVGTGVGLIAGGPGSDLIFGLDSNDCLIGEAGNDTLDGAGGNDLLSGGADNDALTGDDGRDELYGGAGDDAITGGTGDDLINGGPGKDSIAGGAGNDRIVSADGAKDVIDCGAGTDVAYVDSLDVVKNCESKIILTSW